MEFLANHPILAISVIGSFIGTLLSYIAPDFTRDYLCADEDFRIGNLGLTVFVHNGWGHFIGNLFFMIPGALLCEAFYDNGVVIGICAFFAFAISMLCMPMKRASCGYSGVVFLLCSLACMYGLHWWGFVILIALFATSVISDHDASTDVIAHVLGFLYGGIAGFLLNL